SPEQVTRTFCGRVAINDRGIGAPEGIRTSDLCLRRATLYPAELRARDPSIAEAGRSGNVPGTCPSSADAVVRNADLGAGLDREQPRFRRRHPVAIVRPRALPAADHQRCAVAREIGEAVGGLEHAVDDAALGLEVAVRLVVLAVPLPAGSAEILRLFVGQDGEQRVVAGPQAGDALSRRIEIGEHGESLAGAQAEVLAPIAGLVDHVGLLVPWRVDLGLERGRVRLDPGALVLAQLAGETGVGTLQRVLVGARDLDIESGEPGVGADLQLVRILRRRAVE